MNILMVGPDSNAKGGMATVIKNFKNHYPGPNQFYYLDSWTERFSSLTAIKAILKIKKIVKRDKIDIVHFHVAQKGSFYRKALLARMVKKNTVIIFHMHASQFDEFYNHVPSIIKKYIRNSLDQADYVVTLGKKWENFYTSITQTRIVVIENAVKIPKQTNYNSESNQIITLGRLGERKGTYDILKIAARVQEKFPKIEFILYGDGEITQVIKKTQQLGLSNVKIGGWLSHSEQNAVIKNSLIHLLPSYHEGLPMSVLETMSWGIPNITTSVGGIPQVIENHVNSILVGPGEINILENELIDLLENRQILVGYSKLARNRIKISYSLDAYFKKWDSLYNQGAILNE